MKKAQTISHQYILCPNCNKSEHRIDHLKVGTEFGPWACDDEKCGIYFNGIRTEDGATLTVTDDTHRAVFIELQYCDDPNLKIIVSGMESSRGCDKNWWIEYPGHHEYYYNEHTCPTNFLLGVEQVDYKGDIDPHGVFEFVRVLSDEERYQIIHRDDMPWQKQEQKLIEDKK
jgi:hypothetical protein